MMPDRLRSIARVEKALRGCAGVVLVAGLATSVLIWRAQDRAERLGQGSDDSILSPLEDRRQLRELELYGGKGSILMEEAKGLFRGKTLAKTVGVISVITAAGLFLVSVRWPD